MGDATQWQRFQQCGKIGFDYYRFVGFDYDRFVHGQRVTEGEEVVSLCSPKVSQLIYAIRSKSVAAGLWNTKKALEIKDRLSLIPGATVTDYCVITIVLKNLYISESTTNFGVEQLVRLMLWCDLEQPDITRAQIEAEVNTRPIRPCVWTHIEIPDPRLDLRTFYYVFH